VREDLRRLLEPRSVAVVGASSNPDSISGKPLKLLKAYGFGGRVYPVNPKYEELLGFRCYPSLESLPEVPDVVLVGVRAELVEGYVRECAKLEVPFVVIFSSGFSESEGGIPEERLVEIARAGGTRIVGPNCQGLANVERGIPLSFSASLERSRMHRGRICYASQSGAFGYASFGMAVDEGIGFKHVVTTGNQCDLDVVDFGLWWVEEPDVDLIVLYLEGLKDGDKFLRLCEEARRFDKPLAVLKVGRSPTAKAAAQSHTAALTGEERVWDAVFSRYGVIELKDSQDIVDVARAFSAPRNRVRRGGRNVAVLTTSGGGGIIMADRLFELGLSVEELPRSTQERIRPYIPPFGSTRNPVDMTAQVINDPAGFPACLEAVNDDEGVDAVACIISNIVGSSGAQMAKDLVDFYREKARKPVLCCWIMDEEHGEEFWGLLREASVPLYHSIARTAKALEGLCRHSSEVHLRGEVEALPGEALSLLGDEPSEHTSKAFLRALGIPVVEGRLCETLKEALEAARELGYPVAVKVSSPDILHKTEAGAVAIGVRDEGELEEAFERVLERAKAYRPGARISGVLVERMARGVEMMVGGKRDELFGPVVAVGLGGIFVEVLKDVAISPAPVDEGLALKMIEGLRGYPLLRGARGRRPADVGAVAKVVSRLSQIMASFPEIVEVDVNPLFVDESGAVAADALVIRRT